MNIASVLKDNGLNTYSLSKKSGVPLGTVKKIIGGKYEIGKCAAQTVRLLAKALNCSMEELLDFSFKKENPSLSSYPTKIDYYKDMMANRKNLVLAKQSALEYLGLLSFDLDESIYVYGCNEISAPFIVEKVDNFKKISYQKENGVLVSSISQAINDLFRDPLGDSQRLIEALASYYFDHNESYEGLNIDADCLDQFLRFSNDAIKFYDD